MSCEWASWFKAHYKGYERMPSTFDMVTWQMNHTSLLNDVRDKLEVDGVTVLTENQSYFNLRGGSGTVIGGKPDLVSARPRRHRHNLRHQDGSAPGVGHGPGHDLHVRSAVHQPVPWEAFPGAAGLQGRPGCRYSGRQRQRQAFKSELFALIRRIADSQPARRVPSALECGMCDLTPNDCPDRIDAAPARCRGWGVLTGALPESLCPESLRGPSCFHPHPNPLPGEF